MKQLVPTGLDEYIAEHKPGDVVTGRIIEMSGSEGRAELGEGIQAKCRMSAAATQAKESARGAQESPTKTDLSSLGSMLQARWKGAAPAPDAKPEPVRTGQIRQFRITRLDPATKQVEVELTH